MDIIRYVDLWLVSPRSHLLAERQTLAAVCFFTLAFLDKIENRAQSKNVNGQRY